jgi:hypothetical protein
LERDESDDLLAYGNKVSWRSEKIDFCEKNVGDNNESADRAGFKRPHGASSKIQKAKKVEEEMFFSFDSSNFQYFIHRFCVI